MNKEKFEKLLLDLYCNEIITKDELKERIAEREKADRKKSIERYLDLYLAGHITKDVLIDTLSE